VTDSSGGRPALDADAVSRVLDGTTAGVGILDPALRYLYVNPALAAMNGVPAADHLGRTIAEVVPDVDAREEVLRAVLADGVPRETTSSGQTRAVSELDRRHWHGAYHRLEDEAGRVIGLVGILLEVSASREQQRALEEARARLTLLDRAATRIGTTLDMDTTCQELAEFLVSAIADVASVEVLPADAPELEESGGLAARAHPRARPRTRARRAAIRLRRRALAAAPGLLESAVRFGGVGEEVAYQPGSAIPRALRHRRPVLMNLRPEGDLVHEAPTPAHVAAYRAAGYHSALVVPLVARGHAIGTATLIRATGSPPFGPPDVVAASDLAGRAAISLDNALHYTREHAIALELQRALLSEPGRPHPSVEIACRYRPAGRSALVGGDWYDTVRLPFGRTLLAMGDVMGHGVEAAVDMSQYRSMLRYIASAGLPPHRVLHRLDTMIAASDTGRPATCLLAVVDPSRGRCELASAGHLPPAALAPGGGTGLLPVPPGPPLGTGLGGYEPVVCPLLPGDVLLLYTDGLVERRDEDIDASLARLSALRLSTAGTLDTLADRVLDGLTTPTDPEDDIALLAARIQPPGAA
jgi:hypothetical protein